MHQAVTFRETIPQNGIPLVVIWSLGEPGATAIPKKEITLQGLISPLLKMQIFGSTFSREITYDTDGMSKLAELTRGGQRRENADNV